MSPDPVLVDRLNQHGQSHLLRWWGELNEEERARLASEVGAIDFVQLDRLIAELVRERCDDGPGGRPGSADRCHPAAANRWRAGVAPGGKWGPTHWPPARSASFWSPADRAPGWATRDRKGHSHRPGFAASLFQIHAEKIVALGGPARSNDPALYHDQPRKPRCHDRFFREPQPVWPRARAVLHAGADAGGRSGDRQGVAGVERPGRALPDGQAARWLRSPRPGPRGLSSCLDEMPSGACARSFTFRSTTLWFGSPSRRLSVCIARPNAEVSFKVVKRLSPEEKLGVVVAVDGRPQVIEYSDLPAELAGARAGGLARAVGWQHRRSPAGAIVHRALVGESGSPFIGPSRKFLH